MTQAAMTTLTGRSPLTGEVLGTFPVPSATEVEQVVARARRAFPAWRGTAVTERVAALRRLKNLLIEEADAVVRVIVAATGKVEVEALAGDVLTSVAMLDYYVTHAASILAPERRPGGIMFPGSTFSVEWAPLGVVAVIAPWNYPLQLALVPTITALAAGNAVVLKPSELTPTVGALIETLCRRAGLPADVVQVVQGSREVGQALIAARPDKLFFTGSAATGRAVLAAAAAGLIPVDLELGGKDPMIVFADAHLERAVGGALYGACANSGQLCVSVERLVVERRVHDRFVADLTVAAARLRVGQGRDADLGAIISPAQRAVVEAQLDEALRAGAKPTAPVRWDGPFLRPVVLTDVTPAMRLWREETFGPLLAVVPFDDEDEAVALANDSDYGLNASVWTSDLERGARVARRLVTGSCAINDVVKNIGNPHTPFGGTKASGFGRTHGPEGLRAFARPLALMTNDGRSRRERNWFPYGPEVYESVRALLHTVYGDGSTLRKARSVVDAAAAWLDAARRRRTTRDEER
jgi:acyl-CoA reductase-like NAD-dependent aldehyde dehydrogenase